MPAHSSRVRQSGGAAVEFALSFLAFFLLLMLTVSAGVYGYQYSAANRGTESGARAAALCYSGQPTSAAVVTAMSSWLPGVTASDVAVDMLPAGCSGTACTSVRVKLNPSYMRTQGGPLNVSALTFPASVTVTKRLELPQSEC